jgi:hypothetical protein
LGEARRESNLLVSQSRRNHETHRLAIQSSIEQHINQRWSSMASVTSGDFSGSGAMLNQTAFSSLPCLPISSRSSYPLFDHLSTVRGKDTANDRIHRLARLENEKFVPAGSRDDLKLRATGIPQHRMKHTCGIT